MYIKFLQYIDELWIIVPLFTTNHNLPLWLIYAGQLLSQHF